MTRFLAFLVDAAVVGIGLHTAAWLLEAVPRVLGHFAPPVALHAAFAALVPIFVSTYLVIFWWLVGQTPGKWLFGIEVVPVAGGPMTFKRALLRLVGYLISALPVYVGFLWLLGPRRRGWHDLLAGTEVRYVRRRAVVTRPGLSLAPGAAAPAGSRP